MMEVDNEQDLRRMLNSRPRAFVLFYARWCPFCVKFLPVFERYTSKLSEECLRVVLDDENNPLWEEYQVMVVPTVVAFWKGNVQKRLDGELGVGLSEGQFSRFLKEE